MNSKESKVYAIFPLYIPWLLALLTQWTPQLSYVIAWFGSFFIFFWTFSKLTRYINSDLPIEQQIMRPIFLVQIIFAGFMCCTSIFYFLDQVGYQYFEKIREYDAYAEGQLTILAKCQRLSLLGHASLVTGLISVTSSRPLIKKYTLSSHFNIDHFLIVFSLTCYAVGYLIKNISAISQFSIGLRNTGIISGAFILIKGIIERKLKLTAIGGIVFILNFISATLSGYKEHIIVNFLIIGCLLYPHYKRATLIFGIPLIYGLFYILPTYVNIIRTESWSGGASAEQARSEAVQTLMSDQNQAAIDETNWSFLTRRLSEISMFTKFVESTPDVIPFYGLSIVKNAIQAIVPRFLWPGKPITEELAMERVYAAGAIDVHSVVSAKTRPVVDAYLSGGFVGVFIAMFLYGYICQSLCNKAEIFFGGYQMGCMIIFNGLFQPMWRGNNFEFITNSVFYSFVMMLILLQVLRSNGLLVPVPENEYTANQRLL